MTALQKQFVSLHNEKVQIHFFLPAEVMPQTEQQTDRKQQKIHVMVHRSVVRHQRESIASPSEPDVVP